MLIWNPWAGRVCLLAATTALVGCGGGGGNAAATASVPEAATLSAQASLGEKIFNDPSLSVSGRQSCASCHAASQAHSPPNALLAAFLKDSYGVHIGFGQWMLIGLPVSVGMLGFTWWWLTRKNFTLDTAKAEGLIQQELAALGPMSRPEKMVAVVFVLTSLAWVFQPKLKAMLPAVNDTSIAMAAALALFCIPVDAKKRVFLMSWEHAARVPWGVLLLFGGGLSLAGVISSSGLAQWIATALGSLSSLEGILLVALVVAVIIFLTEVTSNTATAAAFLPLLGALAVAQGLPPEVLAIPAAIAASCAFMMPVATPPNAIVFGTGHMHIGAMVRNGFALNLFGVVFVSAISYALVGVIWTAA